MTVNPKVVEEEPEAGEGADTLRPGGVVSVMGGSSSVLEFDVAISGLTAQAEVEAVHTASHNAAAEFPKGNSDWTLVNHPKLIL